MINNKQNFYLFSIWILILPPLAFYNLSILLHVFPITTSHILNKHSFKHISIRQYQSPLSFFVIVMETSFILRPKPLYIYIYIYIFNILTLQFHRDLMGQIIQWAIMVLHCRELHILQTYPQSIDLHRQAFQKSNITYLQYY
jgi:hypothetical protein